MAPSRGLARFAVRMLVALALLVGVFAAPGVLADPAMATVTGEDEDPDPLPPATQELVEAGASVDGTVVAPDLPPAPPVEPGLPSEPPVYPEAGVAELPVTDAPPAEGAVPVVPGHLDGFGPTEASLPVAVWLPVAAEGVEGTGPGGPVSVDDLAGAGEPPSAVTVEVLDPVEVSRLGGIGLAFTLTRADGVAAAGLVTVDAVYDEFRNAAGGNLASRLRLATVPACALTTPGEPACLARTAVDAGNDLEAGLLRGVVTVAGDPSAGTGEGGAGTAGTAEGDGPGIFVVTSSVAGTNGTYAATPIAPTGEWTVGIGSGDFTWSEQLPSVPLPQGGSGSGPGLNYSSGSVDGRTNATNPQASWAGLGWDVSTGSITQNFAQCSPFSTETCFYDETSGRYSINLNGQSSDLVEVAGQPNRYRMVNDPGWQVLHDTVNGAWIVTTQDGTSYYFGWGNTSTLSIWTRWVQNSVGVPESTPWAWSLSHVRDTSDNMTAYYYTPVTNYYQSTTGKRAYTRDGYLSRVEFGRVFNDVEASNLETGQLVFEAQVRCNELDATCVEPTAGSSITDYPDIPFDLLCASTAPSCEETGPSYFSTRRLASVTAKTRSGTTWSDNDRVIFDHDLIDAAAGDDNGLQLWLADIQTFGLDGPTADVPLPPTVFVGAAYDNRADAISSWMLRLASITLPTGGSISVAYAQANPCTSVPEGLGPEADRDCFPAWGTRGNDTEDGFVWYNKWLVTSVTQRAVVGGLDPAVAETTTYAYPADVPGRPNPQIHHDDNENVPADQRGWGIWRGYDQVTVGRGGGQVDVYKVLRGMHNDAGSDPAMWPPIPVPISDVHGNAYQDYEWFKGRIYEHHRFNGAVDTEWTTTRPGWGRLDLGNNNVDVRTTPRMVVDQVVTTTVDVPGGTDRTTKIDTFYDTAAGAPGITYGLPSKLTQHGNLAMGGDERCTTMSYAINPTAWILKPASSKLYPNSSCTATAPARTDTLYDHASVVGASPSDGLVTEVRAFSTATAFSTTLTDQDSRGRVVEVIDPNGNPTITDYSPSNPALGLPTSVTVTNALGHQTVTALHPRRQVPDTITDPNGHVTKLGYDGAGRLSKVWLPTETFPGAASMEYLYDLSLTHAAAPRVTSRTMQSPVGINGASYLSTYTFFDGLARERETQMVAPEGVGRVVTSTRYDDRGLVAAQTLPLHMSGAAGSAMGQPVLAGIPSETRTSYDGLGRVTRTATWSDGAAIAGMDTDYTHTGTATRTVPAVGMATVTNTDAYARTSSVVEEYSPTEHWQTSYSYDERDNLTGITDAAGNTTSYSYDLLSRRTSTDDPDTGVSTSTYDPVGNLITSTDAAADSTTAVFDGLNRQTALRNTTTNTLLASWSYDAAGRNGLLVSSTSRVDGQNYKISNLTYDQRDRLTAKTYVIPAPAALAGSYTFGYGYDSADHRTSISYPAAGGLPAETVTTVFSDRGYEVSTAGDNTYIAQTAYKNYGSLARRDYGGSGTVIRKYSYQAGTRWLDQLRTELNATTIQDTTYTHDLGGNLTGVLTTGDTTLDECFDYDNANRLQTAATRTGPDCTGPYSPGPESYRDYYTYSPIGNLERVAEHVVDQNYLDYQYPAPGPDATRPHAVYRVSTPYIEEGRSILVAEYGHDANGQRTSSRTDINTTDPVERTYQWNEQHQLVQTTTNDGTSTDTSTYIYDADGNQLIRDDGTNATLYLDNTEINTATGTASVRYYTTSTGTLIGLRPASTPWTRIILNHQGSTQYLIRNGTNTIQNLEYQPYGKTRTDTSGLATDRRYLHAPNDDQTGLIQLGARYYDPALAQFISPDPLLEPGKPQSLNPYTNAYNNPTTHTDPTGLSPICGDQPDQCDDGPPTPPGSGPPPPPPGDGDQPGGWLEWIGWNDDQPSLGGGGGGQLGTIHLTLASLRTQPSWYEGGGRAAQGAQLAGRAIAQLMINAIKRLRGPGAANGVGKLPSPGQAAQLLKDAKPVGSALRPDAAHRSASFVLDDVAQNGTVFRTVGGDGVDRVLIQMPGQVNGVAGRFEWILDGGNLTHQMFIRGGTINGIPIKP